MCIYHYITSNLNRILLLLAIYLAVGALAVQCKTDGDHAATCASGKCEVVGSTEVCTQCKAGGVPVDGFCRPASSPQATAAGCTGDASAGVCEACSGGFFLFRGGCYDARAAPGSGVCREVRDGACVGHAEEARAERVGAEEAQDPSTGCQAVSSGGAGSCNTCEAPIGGTAYCSKCNDPSNYAPVDGACVAVETEAGKKALCTVHSNGVCTQCGSTSFLYKGGCYQPGDGKPGQSLCLVAKGGVCTEAATGYFVPTGAANTGQSVVKCNDVNGVPVGDTTYKGVAGCQECATPAAAPGARADKVATCTRCKDQQYLKDNACVADANQCTTGYAAKQDDTNGNRCLACTDQSSGGAANCAECTYDSAKTRLKCTRCGGGKYLKVSGDTTECVADSSACGNGYAGKEDSKNGNRCLACTDQENGGAANCETCEYNTQSSKIKCTKCSGSNYLTTVDGATTCKTECGEGYFKNDKGGSDSQTKVCVSCGDSAHGGVDGCTTCTPKEGDPTKAKCTACATGKKPNTDGTKCVTCTVTNCATCSANDACEVCTDGYRKTDSNTCEKCTPEHCKACANDAKICTECVEGYTPSADGLSCASASANRSGLSTGAIAGISVAAVVVVGGLVGFLCWWFICRGKA